MQVVKDGSGGLWSAPGCWIEGSVLASHQQKLNQFYLPSYFFEMQDKYNKYYKLVFSFRTTGPNITKLSYKTR